MVYLYSVLVSGLFTVCLCSTSSFGARRASTVSRHVKRPEISTRQAEDPCSVIFTPSEINVFLAQDAYDCLGTVPFDPTVASQLIQYYKDTVEFQSTLAYLKNPPPSYQQPAVDLLASLDLISAGISAGAYHNEYEFEAALQSVIYAAHDGHLSLTAGVLAVFSFGSPYALNSISIDVTEVPKVYFSDDLIKAQNTADIQGLAIAKINGEDANQWLTRFAARNSFGLLDPNADWNALMYSPAADIQGIPSVFTGQSPFYPGNNLEFMCENGTIISTQWRSLANVPFDAPPIKNGPDVYQYFVLYETPADGTSSVSTPTDTPIDAPTDVPTNAPADTPSPTSIGDSSSDVPTPTVTSDSQSDSMPTSWGNPAYPSIADVVQPYLGSGGYVTGYFLRDSLIAVLSIPSFEMSGSAIASFSNTIGEFLTSSKAAGMTKVVVDLQQNLGGELLLAIDTFRQFFPSIDPYGGSRLRSFNYSDALGNTYTRYYQQYLAAQQEQNLSVTDALLDIPWAVLDYLNSDTNQNFTSWSEFFGPHPDHGDFFSTVQRDNLSSILFDEVASGGYFDDGTPAGIVIYGYGNRSTTAPPPFAAEDIILLTDGNCHSSCAVFVEMMHHEASVRTIAVGGQPNTGPIQAVAGTRGALSYSAFNLDDNMYSASSVNATVNDYLPSSHTAADLRFWITSAQFNLRDQIRERQDVPLQFVYEAADCRIYWTLATFNNFTALWEQAADAIWRHASLCVKDSTIFPSSANGTTDTKGPSEDQKASWDVAGIRLVQTKTYTPALITPVQQISDGQIQVPATQTGLVTELSDGQPQVPATSIPKPPSSEKAVDSGGLASSNGIASDDIKPRLSTIDAICKPKAQNPCNGEKNVKCIKSPTCTKGKWDDEYRCKLACTSTNQCGGSRGPNFCNLYDSVCILRNGQYRCGTQTQFVGSGGLKSTSSQPSAQGAHQLFFAGYCETKVVAQGGCRQYESQNNPPTSILGAAFQQGIPTLIVDIPTTPKQQHQADGPGIQASPPSSGQHAAVQAGSARKSVGDYIANMWGS